MPIIRCIICNRTYPPAGLPYCCPDCGGIFDYDGPPQIRPAELENDLPGIWRYRHSFDLFPDAPLITLGEGNTPLVWEELDGYPIGLKIEGQNPSGSYKDRGSAVLVSQLLGRGAQFAVEDSSGNAGASFAAYAARARLPARVFVPESASGPKRAQIERYGAELVQVPGPRSAAATAVLKEVEHGAVYASHAYLPFFVTGVATLAYEIWENLGRVPGTVIAPVGHGGLLLGIVRGFTALLQAGLIDHPPYYVGVQAQACAPVVAAFQSGLSAMESITEGSTFAEGVRVRRPIHIEALLREIPPYAGQFLSIPEEDILPAFYDLAHRGFYVEPTSALGWCALKYLFRKTPDPVIVVLSGSGLKYNSQ